MGSRSTERGKAAVDSIALPEGCTGSVEFVQLDVTDNGSVTAAAAAVQAALGPGKLYGLVNNAGTGLAIAGGAENTVNTNLYGVKRVTEAFLPMVQSRIVNVGSGAGPGYVKRCPILRQRELCLGPDSWEQVQL